MLAAARLQNGGTDIDEFERHGTELGSFGTLETYPVTLVLAKPFLLGGSLRHGSGAVAEVALGIRFRVGARAARKSCRALGWRSRSSSSDFEALPDLADPIQRIGALENDQPNIP